jgi:mRNA-degrading endonuclease RelE of RelBE toxin-antitoxin system
MGAGEKKPSWALVQSVAYREEFERLSSKYRSQISRKVMDLTSNPKPGGSRTPLKGYDGLCRVRAGDFRIIYAYDDHIVQVLTLRRRDESTYDDLDELEIEQLEEFRTIKGAGSGEYKIPDWEELAKGWAAPKPKPVEPLPGKITDGMLGRLRVPEEFWPLLLAVTTSDGLLDCEQVPFEFRLKVLEQLCPQKATPPGTEMLPVVVMEDLIDDKAAGISGPIDVADQTEPEKEEVDVSKTSDKKPVRERGGLPARMRVPAPLVFVSTRRLEPMKPYSGNTSRGIGRDARYTVKLDNTIQLLYTVGNNERALLTTDEHPDLVALVNEAKRRGGSQQGGGGFFINEYRHVLVPTMNEQVLYAGVYTKDLEFLFEGTLISPVAPPGIRPGDVWPGPHVGVKYTLAAGAADVRYEEETARGTLRRVCLSDHHSAGALADLLRMFRVIKPNGGAIFINEARELFAPVDDGQGYKRRYIGHLGDRQWFPEPI